MTPEQVTRLQTKMQKYFRWIDSLLLSPSPIRLRRILERYPRGVGIQTIRLFMRQSKTQCEGLLQQWERKGRVYLEFGVETAEEEATRRRNGQQVVRVPCPYRLWCWGQPGMSIFSEEDGEVVGEVVPLRGIHRGVKPEEAS